MCNGSNFASRMVEVLSNPRYVRVGRNLSGIIYYCLSASVRRRNNRPNVFLKGLHVPRLYVDRPRTLETAHQALSGLSRGHEATPGLLNLIVHVPCHQMAIVDHMLLSWL